MSHIGKPHIHNEPCLKRLRVLFGGQFVIDTREAQLVWEKPFYPTYFFPHSALSPHLQIPTDSTPQSPGVEIYDIVLPNKTAPGAVTKFVKTGTDLDGLFKITNWNKVDKWFEEDEEVWVHPKDPYTRVDVLQSSRHVRVEINGVEVANSTKPRLLFETSHPVRTYFPLTDCKLALFRDSQLTTQCPYKGTANYYSIELPSSELIRDVAWWYGTPLPECGQIKGYVAFYDGKVDTFVDGILAEKPKSPWSW